MADTSRKTGIALAISRFALAFIFLWPFFDKLLGLGYSTCRDKTTGAYLGVMCEKAWLVNGSPTQGFLSGVKGPFAWLFNPLAGHWLVNTLFMLALLGIGIALLLGAGLRIAAWSGGILLVAMWFAEWGTFTTNPFLDDHLVYTTLLFVLYLCSAGDTWGIGKWWKGTELVKNHPWLA